MCVWADRRDAGVREAEEMTWGECSPPHTERVHLMNNYHSLLRAVSLAPSLSLSLLLLPALLFLYSQLHLRLACLSSMSFGDQHGAVILSALHQPIDSQIFARPWTNACMPIPLLSPVLFSPSDRCVLLTCSWALSSFGSGVNNRFQALFHCDKKCSSFRR